MGLFYKRVEIEKSQMFMEDDFACLFGADIPESVPLDNKKPSSYDHQHKNNFMSRKLKKRAKDEEVSITQVGLMTL